MLHSIRRLTHARQHLKHFLIDSLRLCLLPASFHNTLWIFCRPTSWRRSWKRIWNVCEHAAELGRTLGDMVVFLDRVQCPVLPAALSQRIPTAAASFSALVLEWGSGMHFL